MHRLYATLLLALMSALVQAAPSHCSGEEDVVFTCSLLRSGKIASLCASKGLLGAKDGGALVYRFGKAGAIEFEFPKERAGSPEEFSYSHYFRAQTDRTQLSFDNEGYRYEIFDDYEGDQKPPSSVGVRVIKPDGKETELHCTKTVQAHWNLIDGAVPCDKDDDPSSCSYKASR